MPNKLAIGVDIGGTKIASGLVNITTGNVIATTRKKNQRTG